MRFFLGKDTLSKSMRVHNANIEKQWRCAEERFPGRDRGGTSGGARFGTLLPVGIVKRIIVISNDPLTKDKNVSVKLELKPDSTNSNYKNALDYLKEKGAKAIFMTGEPVITQIYDAIKSGLSQYDDMVFVGFDAGDRQISWMAEHEKPLLLGSIAQDSYELGYQAVKQVITAAKGKAVEESITTPGVWWDVTNYEELKDRKIVYEG